MQSFAGLARDKPRVNLGGSRKLQTKGELVKKTTAERRQRDDDRRRQTSALVVQSAWRRHLQRKEALAVLRDQFDDIPLTITSVMHATRLFLFFQSEALDQSRFSTLVCYLSKVNMEMIKAMEERCAISLNFQLCKLLRAHQASCEVEAIVLLYKLGCAFQSNLTKDYYKALNSILTRKALRHEFRIGRELSLAITEPLCHYDASYLPFCTELLGNQNLHRFQSLFNELRNAIKLSPLCCCLALLTEVRDDGLISASWEMGPKAVLLGNLINLCAQGIMSATEICQEKFVQVIAGLLNQISALSDSTAYESFEHVNAIEDDEEVDENVSAIRTSQRWSLIPARDEYTIGALSLLCQMSNLEIYLLLPNISNLSLFLVSLIYCCAPIRDDLLLRLTLIATTNQITTNRTQTPLLVRLWQFVKSIAMDSQSTLQLPFLDVRRGAVLLLLAELFSRILVTMADDEFFDCDRNPLPLGDLAELVTFLKEFVYKLYWVQDSVGAKPGMPPYISIRNMRDASVRLLQQLFARDTRRRFLPVGHWLISSHFDMETFVTDVVAEAYAEPQVNNAISLRRQTSLNTVTPHLNILSNCPFFLPFNTRIQILRILVSMDRDHLGYHDHWGRRTRHEVRVRRNREFEDGFDALARIEGGMKGNLSVHYMDAYGLEEAGIDGGGLTKEFLTSLCNQAFNPDFGMFVESPDRFLYPNPTSYARSPAQLQYFEFLGSIVGKCVQEGILIDVALAPFFLQKWLGKESFLDDLQGMDGELYNGLMQLKHYNGDVENDLALDFTITESDFGQSRTVKLLPNGQNISVTKVNRLRYIHLVCNYRLNSRLVRQSQAFANGLGKVIDRKWLAMFNQNELQQLVGGAPVPIDLTDLRNNTVYGGYSENDYTIQLFWTVIGEFSNEERRKLVKFVTSAPRPPLLGFKELNPSFCVRMAGTDISRLPTSSTCVNLLKLPKYDTLELMRNKLRYAISASAGFDLS